MTRTKGLLAAFSTVIVAVGAIAAWLTIRDGGSSEAVSWLYSQTAETAQLDDLGDGTHLLTLSGVDLHTIQFSDRPDRLVEIIDTADLIDGWDTMFASSAPNAVLVEHEPSGETDSLVVVLSRPRLDISAGELTYDVTILADELHPERLVNLADSHPEPPVAMQMVSLFIDSVEDPASSTPLLTGPAAGELASRLGLPDIPVEPIEIGSGVRMISAVADVGADGSMVAEAVIGFSDDSFTIDMDIAVTDPDTWTLTASAGSQDIWTTSRVPGLAIDPSTFSGTITKSGGVVDFDLQGGTHTWQVAGGATYVSQLAFSSICPLDAGRCPEGVGAPFVSMNGTLTISSVPNPIAMSGAMSTDGTWARFDGLAGDLMFAGTGITDSTLTMWRGPRTDSFDPNMVLPSLEALTNGNNLEFCGRMSVDIPRLSNMAADGCLRWTPNGVLVGQVGVAATIDGSMPATDADGSANAEVAGVAHTTLSAESLSSLPSHDAVLAGVPVALQPESMVLAGRASLPGIVTDALGLDLAVERLDVDISGTVSPTAVSLTGAIPTDISIGTEPFLLDVREMALTVEASAGEGFSFRVGTTGEATFGYAPSARTLSTSLQIVAATAPSTGMVLSVDVRGTPSAADAGADGLTVATRLTTPSEAQYIWPDQFGIKGLNLWNLTVQVGFVDGSPSLGYTSTSYVDPGGAQTRNVIACEGTCDESDWLIGTLGFNASYTNPCLAYSIDSASGESGLAIDGGLLMASSFKIGAAPNGCSIQAGAEQLALPEGFFGFQFSAEFGDSPRTTVDVATKVSVDGFVFQGEITQLKLAGILYKDLLLDISITETSSELDFAASMTSGMGDMDIRTSFAANASGFRQSIDASMTNWKWRKSGTVDLKQFTFATSTTIPAQGGCARFSTSARGQLTVGSRDLKLERAAIDLDCNGVKDLYLKVYYTHLVKWNGVTAKSSLELDYPVQIGLRRYLTGDVTFSYDRHFSKKYEGRTFSRDVHVDFEMNLQVDPRSPSQSGFWFVGAFEADRVSGAIGCSMDPGGADFTCGGELRLNPSWAGVYHFDWGEM